MPTAIHTQAKATLNDPETCAAKPMLRRAAWLILKSERGQTVIQHRLNRMARTSEQTS